MIDSGHPGSNEVESIAKQQPSIEPFTFHGNGSDYFRIWIVNMLFTILTLGIYSAWAKVRSKRYFYGNTELAGDRFEYLASPIAILKGRLIAVAALLVYSFSGYISFTASWIAFALLLVLIPLAVVQSLRFNSSNSSWRGVRFGFDGGHGQAYPPHLFWFVFGVATFGLGMPFAWYKINQFHYNHYRFGTTRSTSSATVRGFYGIGIGLVCAAFLVMVLAFMLMFSIGSFIAMIGGGESQLPPEAEAPLIVFPGFLFLYTSLAASYQAMLYRLVFNNIEIDGNRLRNDISIEYVLLILSNTFLIIVTLGFFYPWAAVRRARYLMENIELETRELDTFAAGEFDHASAQGEEFGEAFDLGLGF